MIRVVLAFLLTAFSPQEVLESAGALFDDGHFKEAAEKLDQALPELRESGDTESLAEALSMLSVSYTRIGAFKKALSAQQECYEIDLKEGDPGNISSSLNNLAGIYLSMDRFDEAEQMIREAIGYAEKAGDDAALAIRYGMASDILLKKGKKDEAVSFAEKALEIEQAAGRPGPTAIRQSQLAAAYIEAGKLNEASGLLEEAVEVFQATENWHSLSVCRRQQGTVAAKRGNFQQAAHYLREALTLSRQTGNLLMQKNVSQDLAVVLMDLDPRAAVAYMQDVVALSDTLYQQEAARKMAELSVQNDLLGKEQEIQRQEKKLQSRKKEIFILLGILLVLAVIIAQLLRILHLRKKNNDLLQKAADIKDRLLALGDREDVRNREEVSLLMQELSEMGQDAPSKTLTTREREIARLCCDGLLNKEIADRLNISQRTVETHKNNIFRKLGINSTAELVDLMKQRGL